MKYWLVNRDPYNGLLQSLYNSVVFHPLYTLNNQGFFRGSFGGGVALLKFPYPKNPEKIWDTVFQESPSRPNGLPINSRESFTWII